MWGRNKLFFSETHIDHPPLQLLANPSVLFLDEPTTGLDATSAFQLVRTLKNLALKGRTIITTSKLPRIPSARLWLFER